MKYKKNDIVTCKNGYKYIIEGKKKDEYVCSFFDGRIRDGEKLYCNIQEYSIIKLSGRVWKNCIILGDVK